MVNVINKRAVINDEINKNGKKKRILLVDDESDINLLFKTILEENEFKVDFYNDPLLALQNFKSNSYDLLLLDIKMPIMDGFELYKKLLRIDDKVKVCFITANEMYRDFFRNKLIPQLADMNNSTNCFFILKPIQNEDLIEQLNEIIIR
jgi:two-component system response regulator ChvI